MIIDRVDVTLLRVPFADPPKIGFIAVDNRELVVVEITTRSGLTGMGYLQLLGGGLATIGRCIEEMIAPRLIGRDATEIEGIGAELWKSTYMVGRMGVTQFAISAIDIALWDLVGKHAGLPLHRLWGSSRTEIPAYGSGCWRGLGGAGMIEKAETYVDQGFGAIKMQVGHLYDRHQDARHVADMRAALGPEVEILVDANMAFTTDDAIHLGRALGESDIYWLEEPVVAEDFAGYRRVAQALDMRIVGGENHFTRHDLRPLIEAPEIPILQPDVMRGGLTEMRKIAAMAEAHGKTLAPHLFHELMVQVLASIPNAHWAEYLDFLDDLWVEPVLPQAGHLTVPERPGHGLAFKPDVLKSYVVDG
jgi:D-arabinonate dehydratase